MNEVVLQQVNPGVLVSTYNMCVSYFKSGDP